MKKKLFLLLLIVALAAFVFTGCTPPAEGEGEGEGEGEIEGVLVEFANEYRDGDKVYVRGGVNNTVTVTFPAPVTGMVQVDLSDCTGDYSKGGTYLFPNADRTVWTGSVKFACYSKITSGPCDDNSGTCINVGNDCCATTVTIISGACETDTCIAFPVIVDCDKPYSKINVTVDDCCCDNCEITLKSAKDTEEDPCDSCGRPGSTCCGDDCSGLASWKVDIYSWDGKGQEPFSGTNVYCCEVPPCLELIDNCEEADCPIECVTKCLDVNWEERLRVQLKPFKLIKELVPVPTDYYAVITLKDNVGNTQTYYAVITVSLESDKCKVSVQEYCCEKIGTTYTWSPATTEPGSTIGACDGEYPCSSCDIIA